MPTEKLFEVRESVDLRKLLKCLNSRETAGIEVHDWEIHPDKLHVGIARGGLRDGAKNTLGEKRYGRSKTARVGLEIAPSAHDAFVVIPHSSRTVKLTEGYPFCQLVVATKGAKLVDMKPVRFGELVEYRGDLLAIEDYANQLALNSRHATPGGFYLSMAELDVGPNAAVLGEHGFLGRTFLAPLIHPHSRQHYF